MERLRDRVAVVTGGASGIGRGVVERFLAEGMKVVIADVDTAAIDRTLADLAGRGEVAALMKGSLHSDVFLHAIMQADAKLRTGRLISHCALVSAPTYGRRFIISDAALNIAPSADQNRPPHERPRARSPRRCAVSMAASVASGAARAASAS